MSIARQIAVAVIIAVILGAIWAYIAQVLALSSKYGWVVANFIPHIRNSAHSYVDSWESIRGREV